MRVVPGTSSTARSKVSANSATRARYGSQVVAAGVDQHDARVVLEQQAHHHLGPLAAALLHELLVLAHDGVALLEVRLGDVVAAALLLGLGRERLVGAEQHGDAVVHARHDEGGVLGLEAEDGVGAEAVAEHDGRAGDVGLGHGDAQRLLEPLRADVQLRLELAAVDAVGGAVGELAEDGRAGDERQPARPGLSVWGWSSMVMRHQGSRTSCSDFMVAGGRDVVTSRAGRVRRARWAARRRLTL